MRFWKIFPEEVKFCKMRMRASIDDFEIHEAIAKEMLSDVDHNRAQTHKGSRYPMTDVHLLLPLLTNLKPRLKEESG